MDYRVATRDRAGNSVRILDVGGHIRHFGDGYQRGAPRQNDNVGSHSA